MTRTCSGACAISFRPLRPTPTSDRRVRLGRRRETYSTSAFLVTSDRLVFSLLAISRSFLSISSSAKTVVRFICDLPIYIRMLAYITSPYKVFPLVTSSAGQPADDYLVCGLLLETR